MNVASCPLIYPIYVIKFEEVEEHKLNQCDI